MDRVEIKAMSQTADFAESVPTMAGGVPEKELGAVETAPLLRSENYYCMCGCGGGCENK